MTTQADPISEFHNVVRNRRLERKENQTNFQKVWDFNQGFGVGVAEKPRPKVFTEDTKLVELRMGLIREEVQELEDAVREHNFTEVIDALGDILYVVYGAGCSFGIDLDRAFDIIHRSNMSKLCRTEKEARETVQWYREDEKASSIYDSPAYRRSTDGNHWVVYNKSSGKILKSIYYPAADFSSLLPTAAPNSSAVPDLQ